MHYPAKIVDANAPRARFIVSVDDHFQVFTLHSYAVLKIGTELERPPAERGKTWLIQENRQRFEAFIETAPTTLEDCRRVAWAS